MDELFGVSMTSIAIVLVALLGVALASVAYVILRNRIMFVLGVRNIPRRPAQTVLIILGLMLSTLIISAALTTGDTVDHSLTAQSYRLLGHVDEIVQRDGETEGPPRDIDSSISADVVARLLRSLDDAGTETIDGAVPVLIDAVPVVNPASRQSEPSVNIVGVDAESLDAFPDIESTSSGEALALAPLGPDELYMNEDAADKLATAPGDEVQVFVNNEPHTFRVVDVVEDRLLAGVGDFDSVEGMVTRLDTLQEVLGRPGEVSFVAISNAGGVRDGIDATDDALTALDGVYNSTGLRSTLATYDVKRDLVDSAEEAGNFMATFFLILGLFSIAAGMLLIVMIFVMLAAERKPELGMARAVGTKRGHLVQTFLAEGMAYNIVAAMVGAALGVAVAFGIANVMARIFSEFNISIEPRVTPRTLIISYSLGVVLTFLTVTFASWRVSNLNIVRAIRDIPEPTNQRMSRRWLVAGVAGIGLGVLLIVTGLNGDVAFPFALGWSLATLGVAVLLRYRGFAERLVFTAMGVFLLTFWGFVAGQRLEFLFGELEGDIEMFFLSGIAMVTAATFITVYNADVVLLALSRLGGLFGAILPAVKTAVAYPLASRFRTGMTLAMISLIIFALTMMSTMNLNFDRLFLTDEARGGWDVTVDENPNNPIADLQASLGRAGSTVGDEFRAVGRVEFAGESRVAELDEPRPEFVSYPVFGADEGFVHGGEIPLSGRAAGFEDDEAVWQALATRDDVAVIDHFTVDDAGFQVEGDRLVVSGIDPDQATFDPVTLEVRDAVSGRSAQVDVIGVIDFGASASFFGVYVPQSTFQEVYDEPLLTRHLVGLEDPGASKEAAREIEASLLTFGVQAESIKERIDESLALTSNFFRLMQAFMGLGLFVGIAAVGVIAFRTVVERRQQIGMLRAIGYKRNMVALSFLLESSFVTLLGIVSGIALAIWLSFFLITSDEFPATGAGYVIPWAQIALISGLAFLASLLMTYIPSRQAAQVPIAEALRYE